MKFVLCLVAALSALACQNTADTAPAPETVAAALVFEHANVIPMDQERVLEDQTVLIRDGRIEEVGPAIEAPSDAQRIDARGKYLMPGMAEMHGHIPPPTAPSAQVDAVLFLYVANGVTTVRGMLGYPNQLELRAKANAGEIVAPTLYLAGPSLGGQAVKTAEEAESKVREQHAEGWDLLKIFPGLSRDNYDVIVRTAREVGIPFAGHVPSDVGLLHALEMRQLTIDHLDGYIEYLDGASRAVPDEELRKVARQTREAGTMVVPTMALWEVLRGFPELETLKAFPELQYMPRDQVEQWTNGYIKRRANPEFNFVSAKWTVENRMRLLRIVHEEGVGILFGTDAPQQFSVPGFSIHHEVKRMADAGMSPYEILRSGTASVGAYFQDKDKFGLVAPGHRADLLLLEANPLDDAANIARRAGVMVRGRWIPESEIQAKLAEIAAANGGAD
jgi:imidazolonepropionase-like amidohydrolase